MSWLVLLRWHAIGGQTVTLLVAVYALEMRLPIGALFAVVGLMAASNIGLSARRFREDARGPAWIGATCFSLGDAARADRRLVKPFAAFGCVPRKAAIRKGASRTVGAE